MWYRHNHCHRSCSICVGKYNNCHHYGWCSQVTFYDLKINIEQAQESCNDRLCYMRHEARMIMKKVDEKFLMIIEPWFKYLVTIAQSDRCADNKVFVSHGIPTKLSATPHFKMVSLIKIYLYTSLSQEQILYSCLIYGIRGILYIWLSTFVTIANATVLFYWQQSI